MKAQVILKGEVSTQTELEEEAILIPEAFHTVVNERDQLLGDLNYLKKKLHSVITENEKLLRYLTKHDL